MFRDDQSLSILADQHNDALVVLGRKIEKVINSEINENARKTNFHEAKSDFLQQIVDSTTSLSTSTTKSEISFAATKLLGGTGNKCTIAHKISKHSA